MKPKDNCYYWILWRHRPTAKEWLVALYLDGPGWQFPGALYSVDASDPRILQIGAEVTRAA